MSTLSAVLLLGLGAYLLVVAVRALSSARGGSRQDSSLLTAADGAVVEVGGVVAGGQRLQSPLQGIPAVYWHVRVVRIKRSYTHRYLRRSVDVAQSSSTPFAVRADGVVATVDPRGARMAGGLAVVSRDQASRAASITLEGVAHDMPPEVLGSRIVSEGVLVPDQPVWVRGRVRHEGGMVVLGAIQPDEPLSINLRPLAQRVRTMALIGTAAGAVGLLMVLGSVNALLR